MPEEVFILSIFSVVGVIGCVIAVVLGPIGRAFSRRLDARTGTHSDQTALIEESAQTAQEVRQMREELAEVQERLDFTERLLARGGAAPAPGERP